MRNIILPLIWVIVAAMPTLNAQQAVPSQTTAPQQISKPKPAGTRRQPRVQPTQGPTANNNPARDKRIANNPSPRKPGVNNPGKPAGNSPGNGNTTDNNVGREKTDNRGNYADAMRRHHHERHECDWWKQHYVVIVLVGGGYYYWDSGYWYPAWGYDLNNERYEYDGPIYTYGNLLPDQVIINVQSALKQLGYYAGGLNGSLGVDTRRALTAYQQDYGLERTGAVDEATVRALGLI
jgi:hypothetical protein